MVIDVEQLIDELETLEANFPGISSRFYLDPEAYSSSMAQRRGLVHRRDAKGANRDYRKGIGPSYTDKVSREGLKSSTFSSMNHC